MADEDDNIASTTVTQDEDGNYEATATTEGGSTGSGSSSDGVLSDANAEEAVSDATSDAQS